MATFDHAAPIRAGQPGASSRDDAAADASPDPTRRTFLLQASIGMGAVVAGALIATPAIEALQGASSGATLDAEGLNVQLIAHVRNAAKGEVALMVGTREVVVRDTELVGRLVAAARGQAGR